MRTNIFCDYKLSRVKILQYYCKTSNKSVNASRQWCIVRHIILNERKTLTSIISLLLFCAKFTIIYPIYLKNLLNKRQNLYLILYSNLIFYFIYIIIVIYIKYIFPLFPLSSLFIIFILFILYKTYYKTYIIFLNIIKINNKGKYNS